MSFLVCVLIVVVVEGLGFVMIVVEFKSLRKEKMKGEEKGKKE